MMHTQQQLNYTYYHQQVSQELPCPAEDQVNDVSPPPHTHWW